MLLQSLTYIPNWPASTRGEVAVSLVCKVLWKERSSYSDDENKFILVTFICLDMNDDDEI